MKNTDIKDLKKQLTTFNKSKLSLSEIKEGENLFEGFEINEEEIIMPIAIGKILYTKIFGNEEDIKKYNESDPRFAIATEKQKLNDDQEKILKEIEHFLKEKL